MVDHEPPNGGYGWVCVFCIALINAHTWGINGVSKFILAFGFLFTISIMLTTYFFI